MPVLRILQPNEVAALVKTTDNGNARLLIQQQFDELIAEVSPGQFATVALSDDENKATTRNRLKAAAERRGLTITFRRTRDETVLFQLGEPEAAKS